LPTGSRQEDFYVTPNPKTIIRLDAQDKQGRYVRIQLLNKNYLSLAEVQVIGGELCSPKTKNWRFPEVITIALRCTFFATPIWVAPSFDCTICFKSRKSTAS
jgi:hypothetical protein